VFSCLRLPRNRTRRANKIRVARPATAIRYRWRINLPFDLILKNAVRMIIQTKQTVVLPKFKFSTTRYFTGAKGRMRNAWTPNIYGRKIRWFFEVFSQMEGEWCSSLSYLRHCWSVSRTNPQPAHRHHAHVDMKAKHFPLQS